MLCTVVATCAVVGLAISSPADGAPPKRCGTVHADGTSFSVRASNNLGCGEARRVVRFVLTHGKPTQGAPGKSPAGWSCGYSVGTTNGTTGRAGPACTSGRKQAFGYEKGYRPLSAPISGSRAMEDRER